MKIILVRHGKPDINISGKLSSNEMKLWIENYDKSEVSEDPPSYFFTNSSVRNSFVAASPLPRALTSLNMISIKPDMVDPIFCEAQLPLSNRSWLNLPPMAYAFLLRVLWFIGSSKNVESYCSAKIRSKSAAAKLINLAQKESTILLMGHGIMNRMIGSQLKKQGFRKEKIIGKSYWQVTVYEK
ncbi:hypothetical protein ABRZ24_00580 [Brenneria populi]|uniref:Histidine phosphatase family protein n=1 Tax=Brenneria populi TaxID=1505588 RepID=A0ABU6JKI2_9GAMM|nr:hypothetical protein [Brenneria populi Li et al. 2015]